MKQGGMADIEWDTRIGAPNVKVSTTWVSILHVHPGMFPKVHPGMFPKVIWARWPQSKVKLRSHRYP